MSAFASLIGWLLRSTALIPVAAAQSVSGRANQVANGLLGSFGTGGYVGIVQIIILQVRNILFAIGVLIVIRAGLKLINSQEENNMSTAKRTIASTCVGIMMAFLAERMVDAFYSPGGTWSAGSAAAGAQILSTEVAGILNWALVLVVVVSVLMIVASGLKAIGSFGKEENAAEVKQTVAGVMTGLGLIMLSGIIKVTLGLNPAAVASLPGTPNANAIITKGVAIMTTILQYIGLIAVAVIIYAGILMVLNFGKDDQYEKAKGIVYRAAIGLVIIVLSTTLANFVVRLFD